MGGRGNVGPDAAIPRGMPGVPVGGVPLERPRIPEVPPLPALYSNDVGVQMGDHEVVLDFAYSHPHSGRTSAARIVVGWDMFEKLEGLTAQVMDARREALEKAGVSTGDKPAEEKPAEEADPKAA